MSEELEIGARVRVRSDCPLTLPHYARVLIGEVIGPTVDGHVEVQFGDRAFPVQPEWLERVHEADSEAG